MQRIGIHLASGIAVTALLIALPLIGIGLAGRPLAPYLEFPPLTRHVAHAPFSWPVFGVLSLLILAIVLPFDLHSRRAARQQPRPAARRAFPWWGWAGLAAGAVAWILAWTRFPWFAPLQPFTFSPLWLAYIIVVNALTFRRTGQCLLADRPREFLCLFPVSAAFWWFFEYLNRFVQNWYYQGGENLNAWHYAVYATLPFATVLPAVMSTTELLTTFPRLGAGLERFLPLRVAHPRRAAVSALVLAGAGLMGLGVWPNALFFLLWLAPLAATLALATLSGRAALLAPLSTGNWRRLYLLGMAALICGFFWEMWNFYSLAKWRYDVPYIGAFKIFEMPLLGYAGYLPFGLECAVVAEWTCELAATD
jgi:hypothetical protein